MSENKVDCRITLDIERRRTYFVRVDRWIRGILSTYPPWQGTYVFSSYRNMCVMPCWILRIANSLTSVGTFAEFKTECFSSARQLGWYACVLGTEWVKKKNRKQRWLLAFKKTRSLRGRKLFNCELQRWHSATFLCYPFRVLYLFVRL